MALRLSRDLKNYIINQGVVQQVAGTIGTGGTAVISIYTGTQPADADTEPTGTSGTLLCEIINIGWGGSNGTVGATSGTISASSAGGFAGTAVATGTAGWARIRTYGTNSFGSAGTYVIDGDIGTASTHTFVINTVSVVNAEAVTLVTATIVL